MGRESLLNKTLFVYSTIKNKDNKGFYCDFCKETLLYGFGDMRKLPKTCCFNRAFSRMGTYVFEYLCDAWCHL
ncbi:MAG: hypothetical protein SV062_09730 [Thermodesulfobacteriota bacterium]|nr:hypothetical protein [Thermodesulfobacteriota bacterium]